MPPTRSLLALAILSLSAGASAQEIPRRSVEARDVWSEPNPGVRYLHRTTTTPCEVHALLIDLRREGVRLVATRYEERWQTVSEVAREGSLAAVVNGGFWSGMQRPRGIAAGGGAMWPTALPDPEMGFFAIDAQGRPMVRAPGDAVSEHELASITEAVSGRPMLLDAGEIDRTVLDSFPTANQRQPRTAVGLDRERGTAIVVVVDGRRRSSRGMTLYELARLLEELGAHEAINLDGGGSSEMYVARSGGVVNVPSRGRWEVALERALGRDEPRVREGPAGREEIFVRGVEREVLNHLGVIAPEPPSIAPTAFGSALVGVPAAEPITRAPPVSPGWRLGTWRELAAPLLATTPVLALAVGLAVARRRRRRARDAARGRGPGVQLANLDARASRSAAVSRSP